MTKAAPIMPSGQSAAMPHFWCSQTRALNRIAASRHSVSASESRTTPITLAKVWKIRLQTPVANSRISRVRSIQEWSRPWRFAICQSQMAAIMKAKLVMAFSGSPSRPGAMRSQ